MLLCSLMKKKTGSVSPTFCHAIFHHALITCCNVSWAGYNCSNLSGSGYIWFLSRPCDQESANGSPCLFEWKSRNITNLIITIIYSNFIILPFLNGFPQLIFHINQLVRSWQNLEGTSPQYTINLVQLSKDERTEFVIVIGCQLGVGWGNGWCNSD